MAQSPVRCQQFDEEESGERWATIFTSVHEWNKDGVLRKGREKVGSSNEEQTPTSLQSFLPVIWRKYLSTLGKNPVKSVLLGHK